MIALLCFFLTLFASLFKSKSRLEAENAALRHQLIVLQRCRPSMHQLQRGGGLSRRQWNPRYLRLPMLFRGADDLLIGIPGPAWIPVNLRPAFSPACPARPKPCP